MADSPPLTLRKPIRKLLRKRGEPIKQNVRLQDRGDVVRMSLMKAAHEQYDDVPDEVPQWYDPQENVVVIELPDPDGGEDGGGHSLSDFE